MTGSSRILRYKHRPLHDHATDVVTVKRFVAAVEYSPFYGIEKGAVLQEARMFNDRTVDPRRCQQVSAALTVADATWLGIALAAFLNKHSAC